MQIKNGDKMNIRKKKKIISEQNVQKHVEHAAT